MAKRLWTDLLQVRLTCVGSALVRQEDEAGGVGLA